MLTSNMSEVRTCKRLSIEQMTNDMLKKKKNIQTSKFLKSRGVFK